MKYTGRYCNIECKTAPTPLSPCKTLEDIKKTCERHILNASLSRLDMIENEDLTNLDSFYLTTQERMWNDLLQDVNKMLEEREVEKMLKDAE